MFFNVLQKLLVATVLVVFKLGTGMAADLDDGIPLDEPVDDSLKTEINTSFINSKAKGAIMMGNDETVISEEDGVVGQGNIVIQPGVDLPPGVIIINNSDVSGATAVSQ